MRYLIFNLFNFYIIINFFLNKSVASRILFSISVTFVLSEALVKPSYQYRNYSHRSEKIRVMKLIGLVGRLEWQFFLISLIHFREMRKRNNIYCSASLLWQMSLKNRRWSFSIFFYVSIYCTHKGMFLTQNDKC